MATKRVEEAVISIKSWEPETTQQKEGSPDNKTLKRSLSTLMASPGPGRELLLSFVPPFLVTPSKGPFSLRGPSVVVSAFFLLLLFLDASDNVLMSLVQSGLRSYGAWLLLSVALYAVIRVLRGTDGLSEVCHSVGYSVSGYVVVLLLSVVLSSPSSTSSAVFFTLLVWFEGLAAIRLVLLTMKSMPYPAFQLLVGAMTGTVHILYLLYLRVKLLP